MQIAKYSINFKVRLIICLTLLITSCGDIAIYDKHDPKLHGQKIQFNVEMVYVPIDELTVIINKEKKNYEYSLTEKSYAQNIHTLAKTNFKSIKNDMEFTILKSYLIKVFAPTGDDIRMVVLKDENNIVSILSVSYLKRTNLNKSVYSEYLL